MLPAVAIVGTDAVLAAAPATAVQVAHACLASGFEVAIPASWGDELVAAEMVRRLARRERGPAVACTCPFVRARLQAAGADLAPFLLSLAPPPIALARYLRALYGGRGVRLTYIGTCPAGGDASIDARLDPMEFFAQLAQRGVSLVDQPRVFDSVVPPDRRRWCSLPGGVPAPEVLWSEGGARALVEIEGQDVSSEIAEQVIANARALIDLAPALGCACAGAVNGTLVRDARPTVTAIEPPRALGPVVDPGVPVSFEPPPGSVPPPAGERARGAGSTAPGTPPPDLRPAPARESPRSGYWHSPAVIPDASPTLDAPPPSMSSTSPPYPILGLLVEETLSSAALYRPETARRRSVRRPGTGQIPRARDDAGRTLPRAYVGHRRFSRGTRAGATPDRPAERELRLYTAIEPEVASSSATEPVPGTSDSAPASDAGAGAREARHEGTAGSGHGAAVAAASPPAGDAYRADIDETAGAREASSPPGSFFATSTASRAASIPRSLEDSVIGHVGAAQGATSGSGVPGIPTGDPAAGPIGERLRRSASAPGPRHAPPHVPEQDGLLRPLLFVATIVACVALAVFVLLSL